MTRSPIDPEQWPNDVWPLLALIVVCASLLLGQCLAPVPAHSTQAAEVEPAAGPGGGRAVPPAPPADAGAVGRIEATADAAVAATQRPTGRVYEARLRTTTRPPGQGARPSAMPSPLAPVSGALDFRAATVAAGPDHARAWLTAAGWDGQAYEVDVATGPVRVTDLVAALWCSGGTPQLPLVVGPYRSVARPALNGTVALQLAPDPRAAAAPCWAAVSWRVQSRDRVGFLWAADRPVEAPPAAKSAAVVASVASASSGSQAWAEPITSLPYRARLDPLSGLPPAGLQVCYLAGATTIPGPAFAGEVRCPGEARSSVTGAEWRAACRSITAGWGVSEEQRAAVAVACGRWP